MKGGIIKKRMEALTDSQRLLFEDKLRSINESNVVEKKENTKSHLVAYIEGSVSKEDIQSHLRNHLPDYMIPSKFVILDEFPRLPNGKTDYNMLAIESRKVIAKPKQNLSSPSQVEQKLVTIWEDILNYSPVTIGDNFFEIGGDSILSIQMTSEARKEGILLEANQIFEHQTIRELAIHAQVDLPILNAKNILYTGHVNLSPMQRFYFERHSNAPYLRNQAYRIKLNSNISSGSIERAAHLIIERHESLRLRFVKGPSIWKAEILNPKDIQAYSQRHFDSDIPANYDKLLASIQTDFSLSDLALYKVIHLTAGSSNSSSLLLFSHHLLVDTASWKIIIDDFECVLEQLHNERTIALPPINLPYHKWIETLTNPLNYDEIVKDIPYWLEQISTTDLFRADHQIDYPLAENSIETENLILDSASSKTLLNEANTPYNTNVTDLLIYVLAKTLTDWAKLDSLSIGLECLNRESWDKSIDPVDTVGCLKSHFPLKFDLNGLNISDGIKGVKEKLRQTPQNGHSYSLLRYFSQSEETKRIFNFTPQVHFNYSGTPVGTGENLKNIGIDLQIFKEDHKPQLQINSFVSENKLNLSWNYGLGTISQNTIQEIVAAYEVNLKSVIQHCMNVQNIEYTPSDFPESGLNENELNNLLDQFN